MTVTTYLDSNRISYNGDGATTSFSFPYYFQSIDDLRCIKKLDASPYTETSVTISSIDTAQAVDSVYPNGTDVTLAETVASGYTITIIRDPALTQETDYVENDPFPAATHEAALDKLTIITQRLSERVDRCIELSDGSDTVNNPDGAVYNVGGARIAGGSDAIDDADFTTLSQVESLISDATLDGTGFLSSSFVTPAQLSERITFCTETSGSTTTYTGAVAYGSAPAAYRDGMIIGFRPGSTNTGSSTYNLASLGAKTLKKKDGSTNFSSGELLNDRDYFFRYDGTNLRFLFDSGSTPGDDTVTFAKIADATGTDKGKLLGFNSSTGAPEYVNQGWLKKVADETSIGTGTSVTISSIASGINRFRIVFKTVSTNGGTPYFRFQLGDSGGLQNCDAHYATYFTSAGAGTSATSALSNRMNYFQNPTNGYNFAIEGDHIGGNVWICKTIIYGTNPTNVAEIYHHLSCYYSRFDLTTELTQIGFNLSTNNFDTGTYTLWVGY